MDIWQFLILAIVGFTACAEFGSYAFVHPVTRRLPQKEFLFVEQGLLKTFGRVMPPLMATSAILAIFFAVQGDGGTEGLLRWLGAASITTAIVSTVIFNVPINIVTGKWDIESPPKNWKNTRSKWEFFQGLRSWLLLIGFIFFCVAATV